MDEALQKLIDERVASAVSAATKPLLDQLGQIAEANTKIGAMRTELNTVANTVATQKFASQEDVKRLLGEDAAAREVVAQTKATEQTAEAEKTQKAAEAAAATKAKREAFAADKLKGVPSRYHADLGDDETKWPAAEKAIRDAFAADMKSAGQAVPNVGGSAGGNAPAAGAAKAAGTNGVTAGVAAFAAGIKLPGVEAPAAK